MRTHLVHTAWFDDEVLWLASDADAVFKSLTQLVHDGDQPCWCGFCGADLAPVDWLAIQAEYITLVHI